MSSPIERILAQLGERALIEMLSERISGADLTTVLLDVMRLRAARVTPTQLIARYAADRFTTLPSATFAALRRAEDTAIRSLPSGYEMVALAPLVPFGTHHAMGAVDQNNVLTTIRGQDVAADPTNALALEAATRRGSALRAQPKSTLRVCLAATQRVVRAQLVSGPARFAHFQLFGLLTAGRDSGASQFEIKSVAEHVAFYARCLDACGAERVTVELSDFVGGAHRRVLDGARDALAPFPSIVVVERPDRQRGRGYYVGTSIRIDAVINGQSFEIADGGFVEWTQKLLGSAKERCLISGMGVDRLAIAFEAPTERMGGEL